MKVGGATPLDPVCSEAYSPASALSDREAGPVPFRSMLPPQADLEAYLRGQHVEVIAIVEGIDAETSSTIQVRCRNEACTASPCRDLSRFFYLTPPSVLRNPRPQFPRRGTPTPYKILNLTKALCHA